MTSFELQCRDGDSYRTFYTGTKAGEKWTKRFPPVTARVVRLVIKDATDGPTINEIRLLMIP